MFWGRLVCGDKVGWCGLRAGDLGKVGLIDVPLLLPLSLVPWVLFSIPSFFILSVLCVNSSARRFWKMAPRLEMTLGLRAHFSYWSVSFSRVMS